VASVEKMEVRFCAAIQMGPRRKFLVIDESEFHIEETQMRIFSRFGLVLGFLVLILGLPERTTPQEGFKVNVVLQKDISSYAGRDLLLSVGEINLKPGATGTRHRHPGPTFVYVLEGAVEVELEGAPAKIYHAGETFYEDPHQLHISTRNVSTTGTARILVYHLSHKGEALTQPEK
jgi:quercetin dioxygenase-like cupin family protein